MAGNADKLLIGTLKEKERSEEREPKEMLSMPFTDPAFAH